ncbi:MAG TPA: DUF2142 domain-containing protein [Candidatus Sulfotelmatobacter sp.]|nr:DUF2142 domain-containing protein [Candidatus Sulfotelmatobacter sp.]
MVVRYSHGQIPRGMENYSAESSGYLALYSSCAYLGTAAMFPGGQFPPPAWTLPVETAQHELALEASAWQQQINDEAWQPPLYYAVGAIWWHLGQLFGFKNGYLLYWLRFLDIGVVIGVVLLGYTAARMVFPENRFIQLGVPSILAFMPQSAFYSIETDALSPLCFGALFVCLLQWLRQEVPDWRLGVMTGLAFAATYLTKLTNLSVLAVALAVVAYKLGEWFRTGKIAPAQPALAGFGLCAAIPVGTWMAWCKSNFGDLTGGKMEMACVGWTYKPFLQWWNHPIFTPSGFWTFLSELIRTFWRGEFLWHDKPMASPMLNAIYLSMTIGFVLCALVAMIPGTRACSPMASFQRQGLYLSLACITAAVAFCGFLSIIYDFHNFSNPSREHPYFSFGRFLLSALVPFILLFVFGIDRGLNRFGNVAKYGALVAIILFMVVGEIVTNLPAFSNPYNWWHLP